MRQAARMAKKEGYHRRSAIAAPTIAAHAVKKTASTAMRMNIVPVTITPVCPVANARRFDPVPHRGVFLSGSGSLAMLAAMRWGLRLCRLARTEKALAGGQPSARGPTQKITRGVILTEVWCERSLSKEGYALRWSVAGSRSVVAPSA